MNLNEQIKKALKENKVILGFRESLKYLKTKKAKLVVIANNIPEKMKEKIENTNQKIEIFDGSSKDLGTFCGKPYPVSTIVIKG